MSQTLTPEERGLKRSGYSVGRNVASTEMQLMLRIADVQGVLDALMEHATLFDVDGQPDLVSYRRRIAEVDVARHNLESSVERLSLLLTVGADSLLIAVGRSICETLARVLEAARAQATAFADGA